MVYQQVVVGVLALSLVGCTSTKSPERFPGAELVKVSPADGGERVDVAVDVAAVANPTTWARIKTGFAERPVWSSVKTLGLGAVTYFAGEYVYDELIDSSGEDGNDRTKPTPATIGASSGSRRVFVENFTGSVEIEITDHESGSGDVRLRAITPE
jgi:hypothetical protein